MYAEYQKIISGLIWPITFEGVKRNWNANEVKYHEKIWKLRSKENILDMVQTDPGKPEKTVNFEKYQGNSGMKLTGIIMINAFFIFCFVYALSFITLVKTLAYSGKKDPNQGIFKEKCLKNSQGNLCARLCLNPL